MISGPLVRTHFPVVADASLSSSREVPSGCGSGVAVLGGAIQFDFGLILDMWRPWWDFALSALGVCRTDSS
jgi:hypothetical protein